MSAPTHVREGHPEEDGLVAQHFYRMWRDNDVAADCISADWESRVLAFLGNARRELGYRAFVAESDDGRVVGSAGCQRFAGLYPDVLEPTYRRYGYLWGVYVEPDHRRQGVAHRLTHAATDYLTSIGCTRVLLHASPLGRSVYADLGFQPSNEMRRDLGR